ncbi:hypothetical protein WJX84_002082 [Apatococcus fuscideae]|uniref:Uncharacterized protein n=1 Tax=Apatococcus fuscideae TaxID=2026836 RepID=A0AAW1TE54_9CHLO
MHAPGVCHTTDCFFPALLPGLTRRLLPAPSALKANLQTQSHERHRHACHAQARERNLSAVKLSKKDERELRDLMPTDENLLETSQSEASLTGQPSSSLDGALPDWSYSNENDFRSLLANEVLTVNVTDQDWEQLQYDVKARKSAVIDAAEAHAIWTHHDQVARGGNVYAMTNWIASRMDDIEFEDAYIQQDELTMIPSWIRAFHDLEQNWEEFSAQRAEVEQSAEKFQNLYEQRVQAEEMGMLDPLDTQEVETLEEKEADPLDNLLEGILPNTGPLSDTDDFMLDILPDQVDGEQEVQDYDDGDPDMYSRDFSTRRLE